MKNIFVGNLSFGTTEATLRSMFDSYGSVDRVNIVTDRDTGQGRGFAFVEMRWMPRERSYQRTERAGSGWPGLERQRSQAENRARLGRRWQPGRWTQ